MKVINNILGYKNMKIIQDTNMFSFTLDSVLLARFAKYDKKIDSICDLGTNNAIIPLIVSRYTKAKIVGVEIQKDAADIANKNIEINGLSEQIEVKNIDMKLFKNKNNNKFDIVLSNPPYFKFDESSKTNKKSDSIVISRHEKTINIEELVQVAKVILKNRGKFIMIHLSERVDEIITVLLKNTFTIKKIQFIYSKKNTSAKKVIIESELQGNFGVNVLEPMIVHGRKNNYNKKIKKKFKD